MHNRFENLKLLVLAPNFEDFFRLSTPLLRFSMVRKDSR
ncbi:hypothetical protein D3OALGB2SA_1444 [Olavius algarvensis associated proteobacterium Delta 3]|nr:hypothetical protein D3OALGB2SA_1444 [Olavius algarvensis associated proteobacterium Delta 3]